MIARSLCCLIWLPGGREWAEPISLTEPPLSSKAASTPEWVISASCLLYLFADVLVEQSTIFSRFSGQPPVTLPCGRERVQLGALERTLFVWALWDLHRQGWLTLEPPPAAARRSAVVYLDRAMGTDEPIGLEAEIFATLDRDTTELFDVIKRWGATKDLPLALDGIVSVVQDEAASRGLIELSARPSGRHRKEKGFRRIVSTDCSAIAEVHPAFEIVLESWTEFEHDDPNLAKVLMRRTGECLAVLRPNFGPDYGSPTWVPY